MYLPESKDCGRVRWVDALDAFERLSPTAVVSGHKRDGDPDSSETSRARPYIQQFALAAEEAAGHQDLSEAMVALYPARTNRGVLLNSAKSVTLRRSNSAKTGPVLSAFAVERLQLAVLRRRPSQGP
ncbi:hypothetical protein ACSHXN_36130 [Streptomyces sp. HUAS TT11]|uniref:hypothetical protein n=1 Tax=Streptomyces sp. HUAS TT11 TaxID=3447508 RepID=UPI003F65E887